MRDTVGTHKSVSAAEKEAFDNRVRLLEIDKSALKDRVTKISQVSEKWALEAKEIREQLKVSELHLLTWRNELARAQSKLGDRTWWLISARDGL